MKKKLVKILASCFTAVLLLGTLSGCGTSGSGNDSEAPSSGEASITDSVKIGVCIWSTDDGLGSDSKKALDFTADALGIELVYRTGDYDAESQMTAFENLISAGCQGIMVVTMVDSSTDELLKICEENDVYMQAFFRNIIDEEAYEYCMASEYFAGYVTESEEEAGKMMVDRLAEDGCEVFGLMNREAGIGICDRREEGYMSRLDELNLPYYVSISSGAAQAAELTDAADQLKAAHPDIDAMIVASGAYGGIDAMITDLEGSDIKLTSFDTPADVKGGFEKGNLKVLTTGAQVDSVYALINLYCYITGQPKADKPTELLSNYIYLESVEDADAYAEYFSDFNTYTVDEIKELVTMDSDAFQEEMKTYSLDMVREKVLK